jgi:hypothetical protein
VTSNSFSETCSFNEKIISSLPVKSCAIKFSKSLFKNRRWKIYFRRIDFEDGDDPVSLIGESLIGGGRLEGRPGGRG